MLPRRLWAWPGGKTGVPCATTGVKTVAWSDKTDVSTGALQTSFLVTLQDPFQGPLLRFDASCLPARRAWLSWRADEVEQADAP
jgi:hypothetical protein